MSVRRAVVTGMGVVSPAGCDVPTFWSGLLAGRSCVREIGRFDASGHPTRIAAEVRDFDPSPLGPEWAALGRIGQFAAAATEQALAAARLPGAARARTGLVFGLGLGSYGHAEVFAPCAAAVRSGEVDRRALAERLRETLLPLSPQRRIPGFVAARLAQHHGLLGPVQAVMTACAAGTQALGDALRLVRSGRADVVVAGGSDSELYPMGLASFCLLGALSRRNDDPQRASRPFDAGRDGFVLGEGAGALVIEEREHALSRGAHVHAELLGFGSACDAWRATDPHPEGLGARLAMGRALADAALAPEAIGYVNAHGTSTPLGDRVEVRALQAVFGRHAPRLAVSSTKSMLGHLTVAAGAVEAIATVLSLEQQRVHPTANLERRDPECDLDVVPEGARDLRLEAALSNSFAFGGQTASVVFGRAR